MTQQSQTPTVSRRRKLVVKLLAFIALAVLLYLSPKIEAWVQQRQESAKTQASEPSNIENSEQSEAESSVSGDTTEESAQPDESTVASTEPQESTASPDASVQDEPDTKDEPKAKSSSADEKPKAEDKSDKSKPAEKKKKSSKGSVVPMNRDPAPKRTAGGSSEETIDKKSPEDPEWGKLREIRDNVFESTAGLVYRSGSADGHRLKHVMKHAKDDLSKPVHGVFIGEGDRDVVLALIDEAFDKAKKGGKDVRKEEQNGRTVFTVNMKKVVGFTGGQEGERRGNPECRFIRIVVEREKEVISAFPTNR